MKRTTSTLADQIESSAKAKPEPRSAAPPSPDRLIPTGSTLLNCACSDSPWGAFKMGTTITVPGGTGSGKTALFLTMMAEVCRDKRFKDYQLIHDDAEESREFDLKYLFGKSLAKRLRPPGGYDKKRPIHSVTVRDAQSYLLRLCKEGDPFIYGIDSLDSLTSEEELEREYANAMKKAKSKEHVVELQKSYHTEKARIIGEMLRMTDNNIKKSGSFLFVIQQERAVIGATKFQRKVTTSGGNAPRFYSTHRIWLHKGAMIKDKEYKQKIGHKIRVDLRKNKLTGKERELHLNIYYDYGIDDLSSCVDFLVDNKFWRSPTGSSVYRARHMGLKGTRRELVQQIEENDLEQSFKEQVGIAWLEREEALKLDRKPRYE